MKSTDETPTTASEVDEMIRRWPEIAPPPGGYDALVERTEKRLADDRDVDDALDVFAAPVLPEVPGEPVAKSGSNGEGPRLDTLAALARESSLPPKKESRGTKEPETKESKSGVINLKAMITVAQETEATKLASALEKDAAPSMGASATATTQPATPAPIVATPVAAPAKRSSSNLLAIAAIVLIAGVGAYVMLDRNRAAQDRDERDRLSDEAAEAREVAAADRAARADESDRERAAEPEQARPAAAPEPAAAATTQAEEAEQQDHGARSEGRPARQAQPRNGAAPAQGPGPAAEPGTPPPAEPAPAAPTPAPDTPAPAKRSTQDLDALISGSLGSRAHDPAAPAAATPAQSAAPEGALPQPNRQQIQRGMGRVASAVRACAAGQSGMVMLRITFMSDGSVSNAQVASGPFAGTPAAGCMENAARAARVPAFTNASVTVSYPIMVQPPDPAAPVP